MYHIATSVISPAIVFGATYEERTRRILEYIATYSQLSITRIFISRAIAISIISSATALIGILAQVFIVYTYLGIVLEATSIFISILTTVIFTFGICLLVSTASLLVPLKYIQIVPLISVAIFNLGFTTLSDIGSITINQMYMYSAIYIALGMGIAIASLIAIKKCTDMISINIISSA